MTNEEREAAEQAAFEEIMLSNWTLDDLVYMDKISQATNAYDNFMKSKGQPLEDEDGHA